MAIWYGDAIWRWQWKLAGWFNHDACCWWLVILTGWNLIYMLNTKEFYCWMRTAPWLCHPANDFIYLEPHQAALRTKLILTGVWFRPAYTPTAWLHCANVCSRRNQYLSRVFHLFIVKNPKIWGIAPTLTFFNHQSDPYNLVAKGKICGCMVTM